VAARADLIARLIQLKSDGGSSALMQRIVYGFCSSPAFPAHVERVRTTYAAHRDRMVEAVRRELPDVSLAVPEGGYYVWLTLPAHVDGDAFAARAAEAGVNLIPGSKFYADAGSFPRNRGAARNHVRLSYSFATLEQIDEGVGRLGRIYAASQAA
jgi:2-aminoadipate transaminase